MRSSLIATACAVACFLGTSLFAPPQEAPKGEDMAAMMSKAKRFTQPGPHHKALERFLGKWETETTMMGSPKAEKGKAEFTWLMEGRWLKGEATGTIMGHPLQTFSILGYDSFKQSYVFTQVTNFDTAMYRSEGDMDPSGKALISYGTLDEYLTGEHDKMVRSVWRFPSADKIILEVHDLPIGEQNTKVFEITYTKKP
jgi:hypothetical protein